jgi:ribosomal peptide maturation radical SAM protein 1
MAFRSKTADRVVEDLLTLARKYRQLNFNAVDNIIAMRYFRELLPKLRDAEHDFKIFYETKSNLKKEQLRAMREAGVLQVQPGIESLSTPILRLMKKGVTALQNIRLLKWCAELGIEAGWNVLYGFPGEPPEEYDRMADTMKSLTHLQPPWHLALLDLQRFSPYHQRPRDYGVEVTGPRPFYRLIYPCDEATLGDLAYTFNYTYDDGRQPQIYTGAIRESIDAWQADFPNSTLSYRRGPGFLVINDRRPGLDVYDHTLGETEAKVYLGCDAGATPAAVWKTLLADGETDISLEDVQIFLDEMTEMKLMYEEDGLYLSLAVAANPQPKNAVVAVTEGTLAASTALVKLSRQVVEI